MVYLFCCIIMDKLEKRNARCFEKDSQEFRSCLWFSEVHHRFLSVCNASFSWFLDRPDHSKLEECCFIIICVFCYQAGWAVFCLDFCVGVFVVVILRWLFVAAVQQYFCSVAVLPVIVILLYCWFWFNDSNHSKKKKKVGKISLTSIVCWDEERWTLQRSMISSFSPFVVWTLDELVCLCMEDKCWEP